MNPSEPLAARLADVRARILKAAKASGRDPQSITMIAVSKGHDAALAAQAVSAGHRHFGENRVQEAREKWPALKAAEPDLSVHLIGPLQTNKISEALAVFDVIHTVDRPRLAEKLAGERGGARPFSCFVQVNTGRETQKAGIDPAEADGFIAACLTQWKLPVVGLMCIPPVTEEPALHFAFLREIARRHGLTQLSMGMSDDFETAIAFGATHVRVGTAIFGARVSADGR